MVGCKTQVPSGICRCVDMALCVDMHVGMNTCARAREGVCSVFAYGKNNHQLPVKSSTLDLESLSRAGDGGCPRQS